MVDQETRTSYDLNCHCGNIKCKVTLSDALAPKGTYKINRCNCSICTKNGYLLVYPLREDVVFVEDCDSKLKDYRMGSKQKAHRFCPECGSSVLIDFQHSEHPQERPYLAINARLFRDFDVEAAEYTTFDGRNKLEPKYEI